MEHFCAQTCADTEHFCVQTCADIMEHLPSKSHCYIQQYILNVGYRIATVVLMANEVARL
jgi:glutathione synthase/RimK-type ligase-like ATP-grasp enzyme